MKRNKNKCRHNKRALLRIYGKRCMICGQELKDNEITYHHIKPLYAGGDNEIENGSILGENCCHKMIHLYEYGTKKYTKYTIEIEKFKKYCKT